MVYLLFFLSGAASLVYEVAWARSLGLVFGGSHLAVTTVLVVFMGGLALGSAIIGKRADSTRRPLRLYGLLELGVAGLGLAFLALMRVYPHVYVPLARLGEENRTCLTALRVVLASLAMLGPTTLMGGTLPVLTRFLARHPDRLGRSLSFLYGLNTLGGVLGTLACGFLLLRTVGVTAAQAIAIAVNVAVGVGALLVSRRIERGEPVAAVAGSADLAAEDSAAAATRPGDGPVGATSVRLVLWGTGVAGFCALGYEVLWTRMLGLVVGTSVYSFTLILVSFLGGIAAGSYVIGFAHRHWASGAARRVVVYGAVQAAIGVAALLVTVVMRSLPSQAAGLQDALLGASGTEFAARQGASFVVASAYLFVPACLMGAAFPLAGTVIASARRKTFGGVGEALSFNTIGSILGAGITGFVLVGAFGVERSLQLLSILEIGFGLLIAASVLRPGWIRWALVAATGVLILARAVNVDGLRFWDAKFFAVYTNNGREGFATPEKTKATLALFDVLYFFEGTNETISVVRTRQPVQSFVVNGRTEASTFPEDVQVQLPLGHLPMLLHPNPRKVFVLGTGAGMTLGATLAHPEAERVVLAEIEPGVLPATRTFGEWNHHVLREPLDPRLHIVFNDGRNHLMTTAEKFDVITSDPIHPWSGGAAYLYTRDYFQIAADHLRPGGVACQWLPIYELSTADVKSIVRTFAEAFRYVYLWGTYWDTVLVGSNSEIVLDEAALERRIAVPPVRSDLAKIEMASSEALLAYFLAGPAGTRAFAAGGVVNTDDNLFLEFSAPRSMGLGERTAENILELSRYREPVLPYLVPAAGDGRAAQVRRWQRASATARVYDVAHVASAAVDTRGARYTAAMEALETAHPDYAPYRFLRAVDERRTLPPRLLLDQASFPVLDADGRRKLLRVAAFLTAGEGAPRVSYVDPSRKAVVGHRVVEAPPGRVMDGAHEQVRSTFAALESRYAELSRSAAAEARLHPAEAVVLEAFNVAIEAPGAKLAR